MLFVDIAGFTPLSERVARTGEHGSEALARLLDDFFGSLIDVIHDFDGDVWGMAGDSLLAVWATTSQHEDSAVEAACSAALDASQKLSGVRHGETIEIRTAVSAGVIEVGFVGGHDGHFFPVISGEPVRALSELDERGSPGSLTVDRLTASRLRNAQLETADDRYTRVVSLAALRSVIPPSGIIGADPRTMVARTVRKRIDAEQPDWLSEFRSVTVVFVNLAGLDQRPHPTQRRDVRTVQEIAAEAGGLVTRFLFDDKGATAVVLFGGPDHSHEDDAARALLAARRLTAAFDSDDLPIAIGVASGLAFVGPIGSATRRQFTTTGVVMNRAARIMQYGVRSKRAHRVFLDRATGDLAASEYTAEYVETLRLKGIREPVDVLRPVGLSVDARRPRRAGLVGREDECARLVALRQRTSVGRTALAVISGDAGVGKSSLVEMLLAQLGPVVTHRGVSSAIETTTPLRTWRGVIATLLSVHPDFATRVEIIAGLKRLLAASDDAERTASMIEVALGRDDRSSYLAAMSPDGRALATQELILSLIRAATSRAGGSMILVLEDGQWMDSASRALYRRSVRELPGVLVVMTTRPAIDSPMSIEHADIVDCEMIELGHLRVDDLDALIRATLDVQRVQRVVSAFIWRRSQGHPLHAKELLRSVIDRGLLQIENGECRLTVSPQTLDASSFPSTLAGLIAQRLDALDSQDNVTVRVASVIGDTFSTGLLHSVHPSKPNEIDLAMSLQRLTDAELIEPRGAGSDTYVFRHSLLRSGAYHHMSFDRRRALNRAIAAWCEAHSDGGGVAAGRLAHYWIEADQPMRAVPHLGKAGAGALNAAAYEEAVGFFERAIEGAESLVPVGEGDARSPLDVPGVGTNLLAAWHEGLGRALVNLGRFSECEAAEHRALELIGAEFPMRHRVATAVVRMIGAQALRRVRSTSNDPVRSNGDEIIASAYESLATVYYTDNQALRSVFVVLAHLEAAERSGDPDSMVLGFASIAAACEFGNLGRLASYYEALANRTVDEHPTPRAHAILGLYIGLHLSSQGRWQTSLEALGSASELFDDLGEPVRALTARSVGAVTSFMAGDTDASWSASLGVQADAVMQDHPQFEGIGLTEQACVLLRRGDPAGAIDVLEVALRLGATTGRTQLVWANGLHAVALLRSGRATEARRAAESALSDMSRHRPVAHYHLESYAALAEVGVTLELLHESARSSSVRREAFRQLRRFSVPFRVGRPSLLLWSAQASLARRRVVRARIEARAAQRLAEQMAMPHEVGRSLVIQAQLLGDDEPQRTELLERARELFYRTDSRVALTECNRLAVTNATA